MSEDKTYPIKTYTMPNKPRTKKGIADMAVMSKMRLDIHDDRVAQVCVRLGRQLERIESLSERVAKLEGLAAKRAPVKATTKRVTKRMPAKKP